MQIECHIPCPLAHGMPLHGVIQPQQGPIIPEIICKLSQREFSNVLVLNLKKRSTTFPDYFFFKISLKVGFAYPDSPRRIQNAIFNSSTQPRSFKSTVITIVDAVRQAPYTTRRIF